MSASRSQPARGHGHGHGHGHGDVRGKVLEAIRSFDFSDYGCDDMEELVRDASLDVGPALAAHIAEALG